MWFLGAVYIVFNTFSKDSLAFVTPLLPAATGLACVRTSLTFCLRAGGGCGLRGLVGGRFGGVVGGRFGGLTGGAAGGLPGRRFGGLSLPLFREAAILFATVNDLLMFSGISGIGSTGQPWCRRRAFRRYAM